MSQLDVGDRPRHGERLPLIQQSRSHSAQESEPPIDPCLWILKQWKATLAYEAKGPVPLHVAAMGVGIVISAVFDRMSYQEHPPIMKSPSATTEHYYTWDHVLVSVILFDMLYSITWMRNATLLVPWRHRMIMGVQSFLLLTTQVLFFCKMLGPCAIKWIYVCAPLIAWTALAIAQQKWHSLLGMTVVGAALKLDGVLPWDWSGVFAPIWCLLALFAPLAWLLPDQVRGEDSAWTVFKKWFWLLQAFATYGACIPLVIKLDIGSTVLKKEDGSTWDWLPFRTIVAVWLLPVTCVAILAFFVVRLALRLFSSQWI
ncbi:hypothetical protein LEN26_002040 [Aphanomyces euteiches]|nr:hypothetical protein AeMF1_020229 [Aphanomyces euteiches]KAH9111362.1 hypothetical protein AeMF1_014067 [Aphanomyces euteiches]KAH9122847.1 hypothetical protein AeMF1_006029 [Aphanomyces euteiches]KAH9124782.1 hypothetical protein AeMF1_004512 [Aphanomyces euteiches]KAH9160055.1 hypothetical protein LEN26_002040 [Aphanomyces euteiches]